MKHKKKQME
jgi:hypothetical protein